MTPSERRGVLWGLMAVAMFSLTLPATRRAVLEIDPGFLAIGRGIGAGLISGLILWLTRQPMLCRRDLLVLCGVAAGVVISFPYLTSLAMAGSSSSHGAIVVGLLPLSTAVAGVLLAGERPSFGFWIVSFASTALLAVFILDGSQRSADAADFALVGAVISAAFGYALGGRLAIRLGGWQVICWALMLALPVLGVSAMLVEWPRPAVTWPAWAGFAYVTLISQLIGFFAWYHGLALGGIARVSQIQLLQLFMTLAASAFLLGERIEPRMLAYGTAIIAMVAVGTRLRVGRNANPEARS